MILSDDDIEAMLRGLVEKHLAEEARAAALNWFGKAFPHVSGGREPWAAGPKAGG